MSEEKDAAFKAFLPTITKLYESYDEVNPNDPIARGLINKKILTAVTNAELSVEYLRYCEQQIQGDISEVRRMQLELLITVMNTQNATY